jgi:hypothetical protein
MWYFRNDVVKKIGDDSTTCTRVKMLFDMKWPSVYMSLFTVKKSNWFDNGTTVHTLRSDLMRFKP